MELAGETDALVLVTEWSQFHDLDLPEIARVMNTPILVDGRNFFMPETAIGAGFDYTGVGRCVRTRPQRQEAGVA
jgi:UDPglucose 6-dehydrogenase